MAGRTIQQLFKSIARYNTLMWPHRTVETVEARNGLMAQFFEEGGELAQATRNYFGREYSPEKNTPNDKSHIREEIGDCFDMLICICQAFGIFPRECLEDAVKKLDCLHQKHQEEQRIQAIIKQDSEYRR